MTCPRASKQAEADRERIVLESVLRIARRGRMAHTGYHAELRVIASQAARRLKEVAP